jgi:hypothetical protein
MGGVGGGIREDSPYPNWAAGYNRKPRLALSDFTKCLLNNIITHAMTFQTGN